MTTLVPKDEVHFINGEPFCPFTACYRCTEDGNGLLFRLENEEKNQWAFYNDTTDLIFYVTVVASADSTIKALQRTELVTNADGTHVATIEVDPGFTELFIEGDVKGFTLHLRTEAAPLKHVDFVRGAPPVEYDKIYKCFKNSGNGLLFRLVDSAKKLWYFYNDTTEFIMNVGVEVHSVGEVTPVGETVVENHVGSESTLYSLLIPPGKTDVLFTGIPTDYKLTFEAREVVTKDKTEVTGRANFLNGAPDPSIIPNMSHVYRCFDQHENGLLFRIVDDANKIWAFYNDTTDYSMVVNVRFPPEEVANIALPPVVTTFPDEAAPGGIVAGTVVPPLATVPFLVGVPIKYELAFSAQPAAGTTPVVTPEAVTPVYEHEGPDRRLFPEIDEVYKCFKEHGNGLLFRLVSLRQMQWAYYNDTTDILVHVEVQFDPCEGITPLGSTRKEVDPKNPEKFIFVVDVPPLQTILFVNGHIEAFTTKFTASKIA